MNLVILRIYMNQSDTYKGKTSHDAVLEYLKDSGIAGATVIHGIEGYGTHNEIHTANVLRLGVDLPVIVEVIDDEEKIRNVIPHLKEMLPGALMTLQDIEIVSDSKNLH
ncbi:DUF190 domain-containing protein [Methanohalobium sp.]|uniref:DUF190 domain-containing protein n=1 Tax=Methanohalobium sp. TaxID=2837493 RepID=UPI0025F57515|nr:DUF190 domain-containing protein [Methanohalobium sp.]